MADSFQNQVSEKLKNINRKKKFRLPRNKTLKQVIGDTGRYLGKQYIDKVVEANTTSTNPNVYFGSPLTYGVNLGMNKLNYPNANLGEVLSKTAENTISNYTDKWVVGAALKQHNEGLSAEEAVKRTKKEIVKKAKATEDITDYDNKPRQRLFGGKRKSTKQKRTKQKRTKQKRTKQKRTNKKRGKTMRSKRR
tara:strand:- start:1895 stop:2473 length:579 start_codon:yes stop_codon:yes gene_type:complete